MELVPPWFEIYRFAMVSIHGPQQGFNGARCDPYRTTPAIGLLAAAYSFFGIRPARYA